MTPAVSPSPTQIVSTPTPGFPPGKAVIVTDDLVKWEDLSGGQDYDTATDRCLVVRWNFAQVLINPQTILDIHIYVKRDNQNFSYLGRTADGSAMAFEWRKDAPRIAPPYSSGPAFNHDYVFQVFFLTLSGFPFYFGPYENSGPVEYLQGSDPTPTPTFTPTVNPTATPTSTPSFPTGVALIVTDDLLSMTDLSGSQDYDSPNNRALALRWDYEQLGLDPTAISDTHIYVRVNQTGLYSYLGRTAKGTSTYFQWKQGESHLSPSFRHGPVFDRIYEFRIYYLTQSGSPIFYGPYEPRGAVQFLQGIDPTPTPIGYTPVPTYTPTITPTPRPTTGMEIYITGHVRELIGGQPISGARVAAGEETVYSGWNGEYQLILPKTGVYTIRAQAAGFNDFSVTRMFVKSQTMNIRLLPAPPTPTPTPTPDVSLLTIYGFVYDSVHYTLVPNATIQVGTETTATNGVGFYFLDNIAPGLYTIQVTAPQYREYQIEFYIDGDLELNVPLLHQ